MSDALLNKLPFQDDIESILFRRGLAGKLDGYTLDTAHEIAAMLQERSTTKFIVSYGYTGSRTGFDTEASAQEFWRVEASLTSYVDEGRNQPASIARVITFRDDVTPAVVQS